MERRFRAERIVKGIERLMVNIVRNIEGWEMYGQSVDAKYVSQDSGRSGSDGVDTDKVRSGAQRMISPGLSGSDDQKLRANETALEY